MDDEIRILCVDDERSVLKALRRIFLDEDWEILSAGSAEEGLEILRTVSPVQIIISDYRMPGMTGVDFFREVYTEWPDTIRIVLSGYADTAAIVGAINEGHIYKFIPKPWNDDELRTTIRNAIETWSLKSQNRELSDELKRHAEELERLNEELSRLAAERTEELLNRAARDMAVEERRMAEEEAGRDALLCLDRLPLGVMLVSADGRLRISNRKARELAGGAGTDRGRPLPASLTPLLEEAASSGRSRGRVPLGGAELSVDVSGPGEDESGAFLFLLRDAADD